MDKTLNAYVNEIIAIAIANDKPWDVACNMFLANVKNCDIPGACYYHGANIDYNKVAKDIGEITPEREADMLNTYKEDYNKNMSKVIAFRKKGDYESAKKVMIKA